MEYIILEEKDHYSLAFQVNKYIADGWKPIGGVSSMFCANSWGEGTYYSQALTKVNI